MPKVPQRIKKIAQIASFRQHSKAVFAEQFEKDAKTRKIGLSEGKSLSAATMYRRAVRARFLGPIEQAREIKKWSRMLQNHALASLREKRYKLLDRMPELSQANSWKMQQLAQKQQIRKETHRLITSGLEKAGLIPKTETSKGKKLGTTKG